MGAVQQVDGMDQVGHQKWHSMADIISDMLNASRTGAALGEQMFNNDLHLQQLRSQQAIQQAQQQLYNQQLSDLIYKHDQMVQRQADSQKAWARVQAESNPIAGFAPNGAGGVQPVANPNYMPIEDSMLKNFGPIATQYGDDAMLRDLYYGKQSRDLGVLRQAQAQYQQARPEIEQNKIDAANQRSQDRIDARMNELEQRHQNALDLLDAQQAGRETLQKMRDTARLSIAQGEVSREQWMNRHLNTTMSAIQGTKLGAKMPIADVQKQAIQMLGDAWDSEIGSRRSNSQPSGKVRRYNPSTHMLE